MVVRLFYQWPIYVSLLQNMSGNKRLLVATAAFRNEPFGAPPPHRPTHECRAMKNFAFLADLSRQVSSLRRDQSGVSAVEFAMLLPLMITLYLGAVEISQGVAIQRKVTLTARTVADLASQVTSINNADMTNLLNAASAVVAPFPTGSSRSRSRRWLSTRTASPRSPGAIRSTAPRAVNSTVPLPTALNVPNSQLIWSEVHYNYVPTIGYVVTGALNLFDQIYMRPRLSDTVTGRSSAAISPGLTGSAAPSSP